MIAAASPLMISTNRTMKSEINILDNEEGSGHTRNYNADHEYGGYGRLGSKVTSEITEGDDESADLFEINQLSSVFSFDVRGIEEEGDCVYVAVGNWKGDNTTSMDALVWTLRNIIAAAAQDKSAPPSNTVVYLVHIFPVIHSIPTPLGNLPISNVSPEQVETHKAQERCKRREMLQKFVITCIASKVKVDTILIESDTIAKAILELIPVVNIRKLVLGTSKSNLRRLRSKKGNGVADQVLHSAPEYCQVKMVCEGKEVVESPVASPRGAHDGAAGDSRSVKGEENQFTDYFSCMCFKPKTVDYML